MTTLTKGEGHMLPEGQALSAPGSYCFEGGSPRQPDLPVLGRAGIQVHLRTGHRPNICRAPVLPMNLPHPPGKEACVSMPGGRHQPPCSLIPLGPWIRGAHVHCHKPCRTVPPLETSHTFPSPSRTLYGSHLVFLPWRGHVSPTGLSVCSR